MNTTKLQIQGMGCGHCVGRVKEALAKLEGVHIEKVAIGAADVQYDAALISPESIRQAVADLGYEVLPAEAAA